MKREHFSGIYAIVHTASGRIYVGSAISVLKRWDYHRGRLRRTIHANPYLQRAWSKYGESAFEWRVLERVADPTRLIEREQAWIDRYRATMRHYGFNIAPVAGSLLGRKLSADQRARISQAQRGKVLSADHRAKIAARAMGNQRGIANLAIRQVLARRLTPVQVAAIREAVVAGARVDALAASHGCARATIHRALRGIGYSDAGVPPQSGRAADARRAPAAGRSLTAAQVQAIRLRLAAGASCTAIARDFGVSYSTVSHIKHGRSWQHLPS